jgi:hypothetical protein
MRKILSIAFLLILPVSIFAFQFGLKKGITINEIAEVCGGNESVNIEDEQDSVF